MLAELSLLMIAATPLRAAAPVEYNRDVKPILAENCFACHGFDEKGRKGKLRLDRPDAAHAERETGTPIKPYDVEGSEVWQRIISPHEDEVMPPLDSHRTLSAAQKQIIKTWIEQGGSYAEHWAFVPPQKPAVPSGGSATSNITNPIDAFVRARLSADGLKPSPAADPRTLIRRLSLDLTGLPPSHSEAAEFERAFGINRQTAIESLVSRLLASPHFGERLALDWMDAARYADTNGFSIDGGRHLWLWRDWVIQAFNDNKPYDRFLREQLAGDLLPDRTDAELIASGFQRNNMTTHEGGTIPEENLVTYNADRVKTLGEAVLGLTLACAQCHDHKYDPISQKDYFQLFAYFNTLGDRGLDGNGGINAGPSVQLRTVLRTDEEPVLRDRIATLKTRLATPDAGVLRAWATRERQKLERRGQGFALHPVKVTSASTPNRAWIEVDDASRVHIANAGEMAAFDIATELPPISVPITGLRVVVHPLPSLRGGGWGHGPITKQLAGRTAQAKSPAEVEFPRAPEESKAAPAETHPTKGTFRLTALSVSVDAIRGDQVNLHRLRSLARVTANSWDPAQPPVGCLDPRNESGWSPNLSDAGPVHLTATFSEPVDATTTPHLIAQLNFGAGRSLVPQVVEIFAVTGVDDGTDLPHDVIAALGMPEPARDQTSSELLWQYCAQHAEETRPLRIELANLEDRLATLTQPFSTMVMAVARKPRETFILNRGDYAQPTEKVEEGTPAALPALPPGSPPGRLGLAEWVTMRENPLTARVAVNRFWKLFFGTGIVATPADFGVQGEWPSHPDLLDWLAVDFVEHGWDVKRLVRQITTSSTYQQSAAATTAQLESDPQNRRLARGPRFRLAAEFVRDHALAVSGLLVPRVGGPSVNPYQPFDLWREVSHYGSTPATAQTFVQDHGEKLYRRSLYTYWKRTAPPPAMAAFDAPNREVCTVERGSTNTPLQALVLLNDVQFVEAARAFSERALGPSGGKTDTSRLRWMFGECLSRQPKKQEMDVLQSALRRERARYSSNPAAARAYLTAGESPRDRRISETEHAAWAQVAALLLNLSETVTRN